MGKAWGIPRSVVDGGTVACPTCERRKGLACAKKSKGGEWEGASRRYHPARIEAAIAARQAREKEARNG
jgi:uncharacterized Zn finger protein (UPF0148 family)